MTHISLYEQFHRYLPVFRILGIESESHRPNPAIESKMRDTERDIPVYSSSVLDNNFRYEQFSYPRRPDGMGYYASEVKEPLYSSYKSSPHDISLGRSNRDLYQYKQEKIRDPDEYHSPATDKRSIHRHQFDPQDKEASNTTDGRPGYKDKQNNTDKMKDRYLSEAADDLLEETIDETVRLDPSETMLSQPLDPAAKKFVRVLWDLENVTVSKRFGGLNAVKKLRDFLKRLGLIGHGIDTRVTAFFNPENSPVSSKTIEELDKAGVELVWVATKREDADRKLGYRISQEMHVLRDASNTTFVIISSDRDFRHHMQLLLNGGYSVIIIHNALNSKWSQSLEMYATAAFRWDQDVIGMDPKNPRPRKPSPESSKTKKSVVVTTSESMADEAADTKDGLKPELAISVEGKADNSESDEVVEHKDTTDNDKTASGSMSSSLSETIDEKDNADVKNDLMKSLTTPTQSKRQRNRSKSPSSKHSKHMDEVEKEASKAAVSDTINTEIKTSAPELITSTPSDRMESDHDDESAKSIEQREVKSEMPLQTSTLSDDDDEVNMSDNSNQIRQAIPPDKVQDILIPHKATISPLKGVKFADNRKRNIPSPVSQQSRPQLRFTSTNSPKKATSERSKLDETVDLSNLSLKVRRIHYRLGSSYLTMISTMFTVANQRLNGPLLIP